MSKSNVKDMLQIVSLIILVSVYLNLACYNVIFYKTLAIISWCHSVSVNIFVSCFTSKLITDLGHGTHY